MDNIFPASVTLLRECIRPKLLQRVATAIKLGTCQETCSQDIRNTDEQIEK